MISFKTINSEDLDSLQNDGESVIFCRDDRTLHIDAYNKDGEKIRERVAIPPDEFALEIDMETGHLKYNYGGESNA